MEVLPADMDKLIHLEVLDVSHNNLKDIPAGIGKLTRMKVLNLSNNLLASLPSDLGEENEKLICLDINGNKNFCAPLSTKLVQRASKMEHFFMQNTRLNAIITSKERCRHGGIYYLSLIINS